MAEDNRREFDAFVKAQQKSARNTEIDWNKERDEWLAHLDALYKTIEELLGDYVKSASNSERSPGRTRLQLLRGSALDLQPLILATQTGQLLTLSSGQPAIATFVTVSLLHPAADCPGRGAELSG